MCGITGWVNLQSDLLAVSETDEGVLRSMCGRLRHRGPDSEGIFMAGGIALGIRRLAVIDLLSGDQPFFDESRCNVAILNGEIYNFRELRSDLEKRGNRFVSRSDTEILPHLYEDLGERMVEKLNGMFGFAIWDSSRRRLFIARDRFGKKPFYYGIFNGKLIFGSEIKALLAHPDVETRLSFAALRQFLAFDCVPAPLSIYEGIFKLPAGHTLTVENGDLRIERYWNISFSKHDPVPTINEAAEELRRLMNDSIRMRMISDVPVGIMLSGGIDSSAITAMASQYSGHPLKTFCVAFDEAKYDESRSARRVADYFGTDHNEERLTADKAAALLPEIATWLDEPMSDASILPTYLISRFASSQVTVALGGDGADELFGGYPSYYAHKLIERYIKLPNSIRKNIVENLIRRLPSGDREDGLDFLAKRFMRAVEIPDLVARHFSFFGSFSPNEQESLLTASVRAQTQADLYAGAREWYDLCQFDNRLESSNIVEKMQFLDMKLYLAEDILTKVDRAGMAVSLEIRSPFLDYRIAQFASGLPRNYKLKCDTAKFAFGKTGKYVLKKAVDPLLPSFVTARTKKGFVIPTATWIKGKLNPLVKEMLEPGRITAQGLFDSEHVQHLLREHQTGVANHAKKLWTLMVFELWRENWPSRNQAADRAAQDELRVAA